MLSRSLSWCRLSSSLLALTILLCVLLFYRKRTKRPDMRMFRPICIIKHSSQWLFQPLLSKKIRQRCLPSTQPLVQLVTASSRLTIIYYA